jgi:hypothetical protein
MAGMAAALVLVAGAGTASALFVDYLAERAQMRVARAAPAAKPPEAAPQLADAKPSAPARLPASDAAVPAVASATEALTKTPVGYESPKTVQALLERADAVSSGPQAAVSIDPAVVEEEPLPEETAAEAAEDPRDQTFTAAIVSSRPQPPIAVAATGDVASLVETVKGRIRRVTRHVNLRSGPADEAKVIRVVPAKASVNVLSCESWCQVDYQGTKGWIYKGFIRKS